MNILSIGPDATSYASGSLGEPVQRIYNSAEFLQVEIIKAFNFGSSTRQDRLVAFKARWLVKAQEIWGKERTSTDPDLDANDYSEALRQEAIAAVAVND